MLPRVRFVYFWFARYIVNYSGHGSLGRLVSKQIVADIVNVLSRGEEWIRFWRDGSCSI